MRTDTPARAMVREVHPEVCFWAFAGGVPMRHRKKLKEGFAERMEIIESILPGARTMVDRALNTYKRSEVAKDDIIDALVTVATAESPYNTLHTLPLSPPYNSIGLRMEMVYCHSRLRNAV
jgi:predicted RNase H-like nuclease